MHKKAQPLHEFIRGDLVVCRFFCFLIDGQFSQKRIRNGCPTKKHGIYVRLSLFILFRIENGIRKS